METSFFTEERWLEFVDELAENEFVVIDNFLSEELYQLVRTYFLEKKDEFVKAGIGAGHENQIVREIRGDFSYWLDRKVDDEMHPFFSLTDELVAVLNRFCFLSLSGQEFHFAYYPPGAGYERHLDQFQERNNRMISVVIYLNEGWQPGDGGELKIFQSTTPTGETELLIEPLARRCVLFRSDTVEHQVMATSKFRFSLTGWLLYLPRGMGFMG